MSAVSGALRRAAAACAAALVLATAAFVASAQESPPNPHAPAPVAGTPSPRAPSPHGTSPDDQPIPEGPIRFRAIDISAMWEKSHDGNHEVDPIPLSNRPVRVLVPHGGPLELTTDAEGRLVIPAGSAHPGETIEFAVPAAGQGNWPEMAGTPVRIGPGQPGEVGFVKVHDGPAPLRVVQYLQTATLPGREDGNPSLRVNLFAAVENTATGIWMGPRDAPEAGTFRLPIPAGLTFVSAQISGNDVTATEADAPGGGRELVFRERFYPTAFSGQPQMVRAVLSGSWEGTKGCDFSFRAPWDLKDIRINLESGVLSVDPAAPGDVKLAAAGPNPAVEGRVSTHAWTAGGVTRGQTIALRVVAEDPETAAKWAEEAAQRAAGVQPGSGIHPRVWLILGVITLTIAGGALLAKAIADARTANARPTPERLPDAAGKTAGNSAKLAELEQRRKRGEITSFEYEARRRQLEVAPAPERTPARAPATHAAAPAASGAATTLDEIAARVDVADEATLREDVRTLLAIARRAVR